MKTAALRVLISTWSAPSHFYPMVPLGWALRASGHDVMVACQASFADTAIRSGLPVAVVADDVDVRQIWHGLDAAARELREPEFQRLRAARALSMFLNVAEKISGHVTRFAQTWRPDIIIYEPRSYAGLAAAASIGVPAVRHLYGTDYTYACYPEERAELDAWWDRASAGQPFCPHGALTIDPCPPSLQIPGTSAHQVMRYVPYNGSGAVPRWLLERPGRPRVCVTWGTTFAKEAGHLSPVRATVSALSELSIDVVVAVTAGHRNLLGELGPRARVLESLPLQLLLPSCDAIVHQGGAGTTLTAAAAAVPQLVLPAIADEPLNAERIAESGAGLAVALRAATPGRICSSVQQLLGEPGYRAAAGRLSDEVTRQPSPVDTVGALERLVAH
jgi:UDP:flavonoid glycosyltransferase YjiC (YdhE family)